MTLMLSSKKVGLLNWLIAAAWLLPAIGLAVACRSWPSPCPPWLWNTCVIALAVGMHQWGMDAARLSWEEEEADRKRLAGKLCQAMEELPARLERLPREYEPRRPRGA